MPRPNIDDSAALALLKEILLNLSTEHSKSAERHEAVIELLATDESKSAARHEAVIKLLEKHPRLPLLEEMSNNKTCEPLVDAVQISTPMSDKEQTNVHRSSLQKLEVNTSQSLSEVITEVAEIDGCCARAAFIVNHASFESVVAVLIVINALFMALEIQHDGLQVGYNLQYDGYNRKADQIWPSASTVFQTADWFFGIVFFFEMVIKVSATAHDYFINVWNQVDFVCVVAFVIDKMATSIVPVKPQFIRLLRLFRLLRLVRLIHKLEQLETLYTMTTAIKGMFSILVWSVTLLTTILMTCALVLTQGLHSTYFDDVKIDQLSDVEQQRHTKMFEYFGTFSRCLFSMFELTLANWPPITRTLTEEVSEWFQLLCVIHKIVIGLAVVGVINGVVLKETFKVADTDDTIMVRAKSREKRRIAEKMTKFFAALDIDQSGDIDLDEFLAVAANKDVRMWLNSLEIETDDLVALFQVIDKDQSGTISIDELAARLPRIKGPARGVDVVTMAAHVTTQWERHKRANDKVQTQYSRG